MKRESSGAADLRQGDLIVTVTSTVTVSYTLSMVFMVFTPNFSFFFTFQQTDPMCEASSK